MVSVSQRISDCNSVIEQTKLAVLPFSFPPKDNLTFFGILFRQPSYKIPEARLEPTFVTPCVLY